ncbi:MAG: HU family DNA-binding protein [Hyphomonadaceae bacterium]
MNKAEFINAVAERTDGNKTEAAKYVDAVFDALTDVLKRGDDVRLPAFGVFAVSDTAARTARNPQTGAEIQIPAGKRAKFRPGKALKDALDAANGRGR